MEKILIRSYLPGNDGNFIYDSWMNSYYGHSFMTTMVSRKEFQEKHSKLITKLLSRSIVKVACDPEDRNLIIGYIVFEEDYVHYLYVKEQFRKFGIGNRLLQKANVGKGTRVTHMTIRCKNDSDKRGFIYSPYFDL